MAQYVADFESISTGALTGFTVQRSLAGDNTSVQVADGRKYLRVAKGGSSGTHSVGWNVLNGADHVEQLVKFKVTGSGPTGGRSGILQNVCTVVSNGVNGFTFSFTRAANQPSLMISNGDDTAHYYQYNWTEGDVYWLRSFARTSTNVQRMKIWKDGEDEPASWMINAIYYGPAIASPFSGVTNYAANSTLHVLALSAGTGGDPAPYPIPQEPPESFLIAPADEAKIDIATPELSFKATDINEDDVTFNLQLSTNSDLAPVGDQATYYADGHLSSPTGWTDAANAFDGNIATAATSSSYLNLDLEGKGTTAPSSGDPISKVELRVYGEDISYPPTIGVIGMSIYDNDERLGGVFIESKTPVWSDWEELDEPSGGWTWPKVKGLEINGYAFHMDGHAYDLFCKIYKIEIRVTYGGDDYDFFSDTDAGFSGTDPYTQDTAVSYATQSPLDEGVTYYWRVRAKDPNGTNTWGAWSSIREFTLDMETHHSYWDGTKWTRGNEFVYLDGSFVLDESLLDGSDLLETDDLLGRFEKRPLRVWDGQKWS